jgi:hypothetical protein
LAGLVYWKWLLIALTFGLLQRVSARLGASPEAAMWSSILAVAIAAPFLDVRPQLYTLLGVSVLLNLALLRRPKLWELILLFVVWANLHGGFLFGLMLLGIMVFPWRDLRAEAVYRCAGLVIGPAIAVLINPYGLEAYAYPLEYALNSDSPFRGLAEWRPPFEPGGIRSSLYPLGLLLGTLLMLMSAVPRIRSAVGLYPEIAAMVALTAAMSLTSRRFVILYAVALALLFAPFFTYALARLPRRVPVSALVLGLALGLGVVRLNAYTLRSEPAFHYLTAEYAYPESLLEFARLNELSGKTFAYYNWGGYIHLHAEGDLPVFIDGRANTLFTDDIYREYVSILAGKPGWLEKIEASGARYVIWPHSRGGQRLASELVATGRWVLLYEDAAGVLVARYDENTPDSFRIPSSTLSADIAEAFKALRAGDRVTALAAARRAHKRSPWDHRSCMWLARTLQASGEEGEAVRVVDDCRAVFASRYLR